MYVFEITTTLTVNSTTAIKTKTKKKSAIGKKKVGHWEKKKALAQHYGLPLYTLRRGDKLIRGSESSAVQGKQTKVKERALIALLGVAARVAIKVSDAACRKSAVR